MDDHDEEKRRIRNLFVRSGKSEAEVSEVTDNRRLRSTYGALTTDRHEGSRGLALCYFLFITEYSTFPRISPCGTGDSHMILRCVRTAILECSLQYLGNGRRHGPHVTNRKSHTGRGLVPVSMTVNDLTLNGRNALFSCCFYSI